MEDLMDLEDPGPGSMLNIDRQDPETVRSIFQNVESSWTGAEEEAWSAWDSSLLPNTTAVQVPSPCLMYTEPTAFSLDPVPGNLFLNDQFYGIEELAANEFRNPDIDVPQMDFGVTNDMIMNVENVQTGLIRDGDSLSLFADPSENWGFDNTALVANDYSVTEPIYNGAALAAPIENGHDQSNSLVMSPQSWLRGITVPESTDPDRRAKLIEIVQASAVLLNPAASAHAAIQAYQQRQPPPKKTNKGKKRASPKKARKKIRLLPQPAVTTTTESSNTFTPEAASIQQQTYQYPDTGIQVTIQYWFLFLDTLYPVYPVFNMSMGPPPNPGQTPGEDPYLDSQPPAGASGASPTTTEENKNATLSLEEDEYLYDFEQAGTVNDSLYPDQIEAENQLSDNAEHYPQWDSADPKPLVQEEVDSEPRLALSRVEKTEKGTIIPVLSRHAVFVEYNNDPHSKSFEGWSEMQIYALNDAAHPCTDDIIIVISPKHIGYARLPAVLDAPTTVNNLREFETLITQEIPDPKTTHTWMWAYLISPKVPQYQGNPDLYYAYDTRDPEHQYDAVFNAQNRHAKLHDRLNLWTIRGIGIIAGDYVIAPQGTVSICVGPYAEDGMQYRPHVQIRDSTGTRILKAEGC